MAEADIHSFLVIGLDPVSLAASARRAGYQVYAVDYFGDQDLKRVCSESRSIIRQRAGESCGRLTTDFKPEALLRLTKALLRRREIDAALVSSGLDDHPDVLLELNDLIPILGNHPNIIDKVRDKLKFFSELKRLGLPYPESAIAENFEEAKEKSKDIGYPVVVKPLRGFGGAGIRKACNPRELDQAFQEVSFLDNKALIQEHISGTPASASIISIGNKTITLTVNEQLLGLCEVGQQEPFGYCGNVVPLSTTETVINKCISAVEKVASHFGLIGSNGLDLVISKEGKPYIVEVNPRFQGSLECVERVLGINLVDAHVKACVQGCLPKVSQPSGFCVRLILFASQCSIMPDLSAFEGIRDIPHSGAIVEKGEPICSIVATGAKRKSSIRKAKATAGLIQKTLKIYTAS